VEGIWSLCLPSDLRRNDLQSLTQTPPTLLEAIEALYHFALQSPQLHQCEPINFGRRMSGGMGRGGKRSRIGTHPDRSDAVTWQFGAVQARFMMQNLHVSKEHALAL